MSIVHLIEEHHQIVPSMQKYLLSSSENSYEAFSTILHFDSHSDVGDIRTPNRLPETFLDYNYPYLDNLHVGNAFTLLFHYKVVKDFFWFSPASDCQSICHPFIFNTIFSEIDDVYHYTKHLKLCIDDLYSCKESSESFYRRLSIDSESNLDFLINSLDYAVIDTGLRSAIFMDKPFVLDICLDYFCCNFDQYSHPIRLEITKECFDDIILNPLHPLKLKLGPLVRPIIIQDNYFLDLGGFEAPVYDHDYSQKLMISESRLMNFIKFLRYFKSMPAHIYICRSGLSNYTPSYLLDKLEERLIFTLSEIFPIKIYDESHLFGINS